MAEWGEQDSVLFSAIAEVAVPRRHEMMATVVAAVPFPAGEPFRVVELGSGEGRLAEALLDAFPAATMLALDGSESMRQATAARTARFGARVAVRDFALQTLDWWSLMDGADLVVSSLCLHHLNDAKKQHVYRAIAGRLSPRGAFLVADVIEPADAHSRRLAADAWDHAAEQQANALGQPELYARFRDARWNHCRFPEAADQPAALLHHLIWLKHAGFSAVDCLWLCAGHAVFGGFQNRRPSDKRGSPNGGAPAPAAKAGR